MALPVFHHDAARSHAPPGRAPHVERPQRYDAVVEALRSSDLDLNWEAAREATLDELLGVHAAEHIERVGAACERGAWFDTDTYTVPASEEAARRAAGGALAVGESVAAGRSALSVMRPPGHHATRGRAMGFCLYNNVAVAAHAQTREGRRVAVLDIDVHHGNGTHDIFHARDDVLVVNLHQHPLYPGTGALENTGSGKGAGFTVNLPLPAGTGDAGYLEVFEATVPAILERFDPEVVLVSAGLDTHHLDPLGGFHLTSPAVHRLVASLVAERPVGVVLEGGYDLGALANGVIAIAAALSRVPCPVEERAPDGVRPWSKLGSEVARAHRGTWGIGVGPGP